MSVVLAAIGVAQSNDWLIHKPTTPTTLTSADDVLMLTNGLISRSFVARGGAFCTVDLRHEVSSRSFFRALAPEGGVGT